MTSNRNFTPEEWGRLEELIANRISPRVSLIQDTLREIVDANPGGEITVSVLSLSAVHLMAEDLFNEVEESLTILDF